MYTPDTSCIKGTSVMKVWIKQPCGHTVGDFVTAFRVRKPVGTFAKQAPTIWKHLPSLRSRITDLTKKCSCTLDRTYNFRYNLQRYFTLTENWVAIKFSVAIVMNLQNQKEKGRLKVKINVIFSHKINILEKGKLIQCVQWSVCSVFQSSREDFTFFRPGQGILWLNETCHIHY